MGEQSFKCIRKSYNRINKIKTVKCDSIALSVYRIFIICLSVMRRVKRRFSHCLFSVRWIFMGLKTNKTTTRLFGICDESKKTFKPEWKRNIRYFILLFLICIQPSVFARSAVGLLHYRVFVSGFAEDLFFVFGFFRPSLLNYFRLAFFFDSNYIQLPFNRNFNPSWSVVIYYDHLVL